MGRSTTTNETDATTNATAIRAAASSAPVSPIRSGVMHTKIGQCHRYRP